MEILSKVFGSAARVKIMRLFLLNKGKWFKSADIVKRSRIGADVARRELRLLTSICFIKSRGGQWSFDTSFKHTAEFEGLLVSADTLDKKSIADNFKKVGRVKLLIVSGVFTKNKDSRVDLLIVGDKLKRKKVEEVMRKFEAELGTELIYAIFETKEFLYRLNMYDKLARDILDFPHEIVLQAKELSPTLTFKKR